MPSRREGPPDPLGKRALFWVPGTHVSGESAVAAAGAPTAPLAVGKRALYSGALPDGPTAAHGRGARGPTRDLAGGVPALRPGLVASGCSTCSAPSSPIGIWLPRGRFDRRMTCPACHKRSWCSVTMRRASSRFRRLGPHPLGGPCLPQSRAGRSDGLHGREAPGQSQPDECEQGEHGERGPQAVDAGRCVVPTRWRSAVSVGTSALARAAERSLSLTKGIPARVPPAPSMPWLSGTAGSLATAPRNVEVSTAIRMVPARAVPMDAPGS